MEPFAYGLRDSSFWKTPIAIDRAKLIQRPVPDDWKWVLKDGSVQLLPLVKDESRKYQPGWCTYSQDFDSPETEVICGGLNGKTPTAAALWRQGNLFHFGFEQSPSEMNETGHALLVNSILYIARFSEDRPIPRTPSPFAGTDAWPRSATDRLLKREGVDARFLEWMFSDRAREQGNVKDLAAFKTWYEKHRDFLHADPKTGKVTLDEEALAFGVSPSRREFFSKAIAAIREGKEPAVQARQLLARYAPEGPAKESSAEEWSKWFDENHPYLFFSDSGWYRWYIDPLAKNRKTPTVQLTGHLRATAR